MPDKVRTFVERLAARTDQGRVNWERTPNEGIYQSSFPNYTVHIFARPARDEDERDDYELQIKDEDGAVIENVTASMLFTGPRDSIFDRMETMFRSARRRALGVDKAVDAILSALGPDDPPLTDEDVPF